jgi:hypothetical protein
MQFYHFNCKNINYINSRIFGIFSQIIMYYKCSFYLFHEMKCRSSVSNVTGYDVHSRGSISGWALEVSSSSPHQNGCAVLFHDYQAILPQGKSDQNLTTYLHLVLRFRICGDRVSLPPKSLHGVVFRHRAALAFPLHVI